MSSDSALPDLVSTVLLAAEVNDNLQVRLKVRKGNC